MPGNEAADRLAKKATNNGPPASTQTSLAYLKRMACDKMKKEWQQWWGIISQKGREYYRHFRLKPDKIFQKDNRMLISTVTQPRTGHGYFNSYLSKIPTSNVEDKGCSCSGAPPQTPAHLILRCHQHAKARVMGAKGDTQNPQTASRPPPLHQHGSRSTGQISENYQIGNHDKPANATGWGTLDQPQDEHHNGSSRVTGDEAEEENGRE